MHRDFYLSNEQLVDITARMAEKTRKGLETDGEEISCIPTFVPLENIPEHGRLVALELGGTNIRCAQLTLDNGGLRIEKGPIKEALTNRQKRRMLREDFLGRLAGVIHRVSPDPNLPLGYCFSYPSEPTRDGDAVLLRWTKEFSVVDTVGRKVGRMLCRYLSRGNSPWQCRRVRVINDTVAALAAGMGVSEADAYIGLVVGTGTNMAVLLKPFLIPKISGAAQPSYALPVNLESGNFNPPYLTEWDKKLDAASYRPGQHLLEKAVAGRYLAELLKLRMPACRIDPSQGGAAVFDKAYGSSAASGGESRLARQIIERSARLVAASLAGVISMMARQCPLRKIVITAEGSVFWGHPAYKKTAEAALQDLLGAMGMPEIDFEFVSVEHANLLGIAISCLAG